MTFRIEIADLSHLDDIVQLNVIEYYDSIRLWQKSSIEERWEKVGWWGDLRLLKWYYNILITHKGGILQVYLDNELVGELDYIKCNDLIDGVITPRFHIIWLLVTKSHRKKGAAKSLINYLKNNISENYPIWVEPEDIRSENLYKQMGKEIEKIINYEFDSIKFKISYDKSVVRDESLYTLLDLPKILTNWFVLIGNYFCPTYDFSQLASSEKIVRPFLWGNTPPAQVIKYEFEHYCCLVVMTQYPRILAKQHIPEHVFTTIMNQILYDLFLIGFDKIYLQTYNSRGVSSYLENMGFSQTEDDPIYQIS